MDPSNGVPLAVFLTFINVWAARQFGAPSSEASGADACRRVGILLMAGGATACLSHVWTDILKVRPLQRGLMATSALSEVADV